jgi:hypothetical protein
MDGNPRTVYPPLSSAGPACDRQIAKKRALAGVQKALDVFKLIVGGERAAHVKPSPVFALGACRFEWLKKLTARAVIRAG